MTEREYINVRELSQVKDALVILSGITPENSMVIKTNELLEITSKLYDWHDEIHKIIEVK